MAAHEPLLPILLSLFSWIQWDPTPWTLSLTHQGLHNTTPVTLFRFNRPDSTTPSNLHLGEEQVSVLLHEEKLIGFVRLEAIHRNAPLPTRSKAQEVTDLFLAQFAPDLLSSHEILWIEPHNETILILENGQCREKTITGMKVKSIDPKTGLYFWTIVGADHNVFIFEREIHWITFPGKRGTHKWLHDTWLADHLSPPPETP